MNAMNDLIRQNTLSAPEAAKILGVHPNTVRNMVARGELERVVVGGGPNGKRITRASIEAYQARVSEALGLATGTHGVA